RGRGGEGAEPAHERAVVHLAEGGRGRPRHEPRAGRADGGGLPPPPRRDAGARPAVARRRLPQARGRLLPLPRRVGLLRPGDAGRDRDRGERGAVRVPAGGARRGARPRLRLRRRLRRAPLLRRLDGRPREGRRPHRGRAGRAAVGGTTDHGPWTTARMPMSNFWMVRAGEGGYLVEDFEQSGCAAIGWQGTGDLSGIPSLDAMRERVRRVFPDMKPVVVTISASVLFKFAHIMQPGDRIVTYDPQRREYVLGTVVSAYRFDPGALPDYNHVRDVQWEARVSRDDL